MNHRIESMKPSASMVFSWHAPKKCRKPIPPLSVWLAASQTLPPPDRISMAAPQPDPRRAIPTTWWVPRLPELRQAIQKSCGRRTILDYDVNCIMVTPGKNAIYLAVQAILNEGDEVLVLDPPLGVLKAHCPGRRRRDCEGKKLDYRQDYRITAEALEAACTDKTRLIIINYPNNPPPAVSFTGTRPIFWKAFIFASPQVYMLSDEV